MKYLDSLLIFGTVAAGEFKRSASEGVVVLEESQPVGGDILVYARVGDPNARVTLRQLLDDLPGERVNASLYEVSTADWDEGLWEEEVDRMREIIDPTSDTLIYWQVVQGKLVRTCIAGRLI